MPMSPDECRAAREHLNWTRDELSRAADVPLWFLVAFEDDKGTGGFLAHWEMALRTALGRAGSDFQGALEPESVFDRDLPEKLTTPFDAEEQIDAYVVAQLKALLP
jgi:hypothetical protein